MMKKIGLLTILVSISATSLATTNTFNFTTGGTWAGGASESNNTQKFTGNTLSFDNTDAKLSISAWSSSLYGNVSNCSDNPTSNNASSTDRCVQQARLDRYYPGLGVSNADELSERTHWNGRVKVPDHAISNSFNDYDMILLSFDKAVNIASVNVGYSAQYTNNNRRRLWNGNAGLSALAYGGNSFNESNPFDSGSTWSDLVTNGGWDSLEQDAKINGGVSSIASAGKFSKYWLIGAAHAVDRNAGNITDHLKISGISYAVKPNDPGTGTSINAPSTALFFLSFIGIAAYRKFKK